VARFEQSSTAIPDSVPLLRNAVASFLEDSGADEPLVQAVKLAVSEALTNCVLHAYPDGEPGPVQITARIDGSGVVVTIRDRGRGMVPRPDSPGAGLGLPIIAQVAASVEISHGNHDGTTLKMSFAL
jgi:anti-sigma regulatory factor (Ser/Thr protein kinase)